MSRASVTVRYRPLKDGTFSIFIDIYENRVRRTKMLDLRVAKDYSKVKNVLKADKEAVEIANQTALDYQRELAMKKLGVSQIFEDKGKHDFISFWENLIESKPRKSFIMLLAKFKSYLEFRNKKTILFKELDYRLFNDFFISEQFVNCENNSLRLYISVMNTVIIEAKKQKYITENPIAEIKKPKPTAAKIDYLTEAEVIALQDEAFNWHNKDIRSAFLFSVFTGLRWSDVSLITWENINLREQKIRIKMQKTGDFLENDLSEDALYLLATLQKGMPNEKIFSLPNPQRANTIINTWAKRAGIKKHVTWHVARHTFACFLISQGVDLYTVSKLLGHTNISTTQKYAKVVGAVKKEALAKLPKLFKK